MELGGGLRPRWPLWGEGCGAGIGLEPHMSSQAILTKQEAMSLNLKEVTGGSRKERAEPAHAPSPLGLCPDGHWAFPVCSRL